MSEDKGTMFPALDGSAPGDQPTSEDITGMPLKPMTEKKDWEPSFVGGSTVSSVTEEGMPPVEGAAGVVETEPEPEVPKRRGKTAVERIAQLTRRYRDEQTESAGLREELRATQKKIQELEDGISTRPRAAPTSRDSLGEPYTEEAGSHGQQPFADTAAIVRQEVRRAIEPIAKRFDEQDRASALEREQLQTYQEAVAEVPELADPQSEESEAFRRIWSQSPLQKSPDGPLHVALMVKGAFSDERRGDATQRARKRAAGVVTPGPRSVDTQPSLGKQGMKNVLDEGFKRFQEGDESPETFIALRKAQRRIKR